MIPTKLTNGIDMLADSNVCMMIKLVSTPIRGSLMTIVVAIYILGKSVVRKLGHLYTLTACLPAYFTSLFMPYYRMKTT